MEVEDATDDKEYLEVGFASETGSAGYPAIDFSRIFIQITFFAASQRITKKIVNYMIINYVFSLPKFSVFSQPDIWPDTRKGRI